MLTAASLLLALSGCRSSRLPVDTYVSGFSADTVIHNDFTLLSIERIDSVFVHDSIFVERWRDGDTVRELKYVEKVRYRDRWRTDTAIVMRADTVVSVTTDTLFVETQVFDRKSKTASRSFILGIISVVFISLLAYLLYSSSKP